MIDRGIYSCYNYNMDKEKIRLYDRGWKRQYKLKYPEKVKEKRRKRYHREKQNPEWLKKHREYMNVYQKKWRKNNPEYQKQHLEGVKKWYRNHSKEI